MPRIAAPRPWLPDRRSEQQFQGEAAMTHHRLAILCGTVSLSVISFAGPTFAQGQDQPAAAPSSGLEELVVTARRREEKVQTVPLSITAFNQNQLQQQRIESLSGLQYDVPSLAYRSVGRDSDDIVSLRGLSGVIVYLNEVPLGGVAAAGTGGGSGPGGGAGPGILYDLDNVEVLKGPQGTLFGRNTTGGAILIQAKKPTNDFEGYAQIQLGDYNDREFEGAVNIPVIQDKLLVRLSANIAERDGFTHVLNTPQGPKDLDNRDYWAERLQITLRPSDDFENDVLAYSDYKDEAGTGAFLVAANPKILAADGGAAFATQAASIIARQNALGPRTLLGESVDNSLDKSWTFGVLDTARWDINDNLTLKNIASFVESKVTNNHDLDGSSLVILDQSSQYGWQTDTAQITEEIQLQGKALNDKLTMTGGGFLLFSHPEAPQNNPAELQSTFTTASGGIGIHVEPTVINVQERSQAVFAQAEYDLSGIDDSLDGFKFTAGGRYTWDWRSVANGQYTLATLAPGTPPIRLCSQLGADANCVVAGGGNFSALNYLFELSYQPTPDTLAYVRTSKGYQSGGFNLLSPTASEKEFQPEYLTDVEVGLKSDWDIYGMKARTNIDYYYGWYDQIQESVPVINPLNGTTVTLVTNAASADVDGVEFEGTLVPFPNLELTGKYSYNHSSYNSFVTLTANYSGEPFLYAPKNKYTLAGRYHLPIDSDWGDISLYANYNWQGHVYLGLDTSSPNTTEGDVKILDVGVDWRGVAGYPVDLGFFMTNALDSTYVQGSYALYSTSGYVADVYGEPRMWGFKVRYHFGGPSEEPTPAAPYTPPPAVAVAPSVPHSYLVFFDFNKSDLTPQAVSIVNQAAANAGPAKVTQLTVTGHTDTVGSDAYNMRLSRRRAESVAAQLEKDGIPSSEIAIVAKGKRDLLVPTADGVKEPQNRRVQIIYDGEASS
jgi:iron complex outermembrane receptor protein